MRANCSIGRGSRGISPQMAVPKTAVSGKRSAARRSGVRRRLTPSAPGRRFHRGWLRACPIDPIGLEGAGVCSRICFARGCAVTWTTSDFGLDMWNLPQRSLESATVEQGAAGPGVPGGPGLGPGAVRGVWGRRCCGNKGERQEGICLQVCSCRGEVAFQSPTETFLLSHGTCQDFEIIFHLSKVKEN